MHGTQGFLRMDHPWKGKAQAKEPTWRCSGRSPLSARSGAQLWVLHLLSCYPETLVFVRPVCSPGIHYHTNARGCPCTPASWVRRRDGSPGTARRSEGLHRWAGPLFLPAREAVMGNSQPASVPANRSRYCVLLIVTSYRGIRGVAVDTEYKNPEPSARPNTCLGIQLQSPCAKEDPSRRAIKKSDLFANSL